MMEEILDKTITKIVFDIEEDILGRMGLGSVFQNIDKDIKEEIRNKWKEIIKEKLKEHEKYEKNIHFIYNFLQSHFDGSLYKHTKQ